MPDAHRCVCAFSRLCPGRQGPACRLPLTSGIDRLSMHLTFPGFPAASILLCLWAGVQPVLGWPWGQLCPPAWTGNWTRPGQHPNAAWAPPGSHRLLRLSAHLLPNPEHQAPPWANIYLAVKGSQDEGPGRFSEPPRHRSKGAANWPGRVVSLGPGLQGSCMHREDLGLHGNAEKDAPPGRRPRLRCSGHLSRVQRAWEAPPGMCPGAQASGTDAATAEARGIQGSQPGVPRS